MRLTAIALITLALTSLSYSFEQDISLSEYWSRPITSKGGQSILSQLHPDTCAKCHQSQHDDWKGALHSRSMGPGILSQFDPAASPELAASCYYCHAPLVEQNEMIGAANKDGGYRKNPDFDIKLKLSGVTCAVCHVREGSVFGPLTNKASGGKKSISNPAHTTVPRDFFEKAEFCAACHQLDEGYELNGKLLTNTYTEWKESRYSKDNIICQKCHMPDRRHLFRGIHDPDMVKKGITIETNKAQTNAGMNANLKITNTGAGHYFPTYVTPLVVIKGYLMDSKGNMLSKTVKQAFIGRKVNLDLSKEIFDTRIAPFKSMEFNYRIQHPVKTGKLIFEVWVYPDEFYNRFFSSMLQEKTASMRKEKIKQALENSSSSHYLLFKKELPLK